MTRAWTGLLLALLFSASASAQEIRRWVDAEGRVHFGDSAAAPGASAAVSPSRGNFVGGQHRAEATSAAATEATPRSWAHAIRSERLAPPASERTAVAPSPPPAPASGEPSSRLADAAPADCMPIEYKKISARSGQIVRMRRFPCQPGVAPVEVGPH